MLCAEVEAEISSGKTRVSSSDRRFVALYIPKFSRVTVQKFVEDHSLMPQWKLPENYEELVGGEDNRGNSK